LESQIARSVPTTSGLKHHLQEFNPTSVRLQAVPLFLATIALLIPAWTERIVERTTCSAG
jgi:Ca2+/H+ antiporter